MVMDFFPFPERSFFFLKRSGADNFFATSDINQDMKDTRKIQERYKKDTRKIQERSYCCSRSLE